MSSEGSRTQQNTNACQDSGKSPPQEVLISSQTGFSRELGQVKEQQSILGCQKAGWWGGGQCAEMEAFCLRTLTVCSPVAPHLKNSQEPGISRQQSKAGSVAPSGPEEVLCLLLHMLISQLMQQQSQLRPTGEGD